MLRAGNTASYNVKAAVNLQAGLNFHTTLGSGAPATDYIVVTSLGQPSDVTQTLQGMAATPNITTNYALGSDINASDTDPSKGNLFGTVGFMPIGSVSAAYTGSFDGLGHTISNLYIARSGITNVGLFGNLGTTAKVLNLGLSNVNITGNSSVGGLAGASLGYVSNSFSTGVVTGLSSSVGGLIGASSGGSGSVPAIINSYSTAMVSGTSSVGGLVGHSTVGAIIGSYATGNTGNATGTTTVGGLVGYNESTITNSWASGNASGTAYVGGLLGQSSTGVISTSYALGNATSTGGYVGGLIGQNSSIVHDVYAKGNATGSNAYVGGLIGQNSAAISNSFSTGVVTGVPIYYTSTGALLGTNTGVLTNTYLNSDTAGTNLGIGNTVGTATPLTTVQMMDPLNFVGFDFTGTPSVWYYAAPMATPVLRSLMTNITVTAANVTRTYDGTAHTQDNRG